MAKKTTNVVNMDDAFFARGVSQLENYLGQRARCKVQIGKVLLGFQEKMVGKDRFVSWLEKFCGKYLDFSVSTAYRYMEVAKGEFLNGGKENRGRPKGSGRTAPAGGRGRGGGKGTTTDSVVPPASLAATPPANPTPAHPHAPRAGQEGADKSISASSAPSPLVVALDASTAKIKKLEQAQAILMETNRDLARQLEATEAKLAGIPAELLSPKATLGDLAAANPDTLRALARKAGMVFPEEMEPEAGQEQKRISDLLEKLRERDMRIDELNAQIAAGTDGATKKRLDNQAKVIEDLRKSETEQKRCAEAARKPGPRGLATMFQLMARGDQMEFVRALAGCDDPAPGEQDTDKVGWIEIVFKKIHSPQVKRELLGNLSSSELAGALAERKVIGSARTAPPSADDRQPVEHRRLAEPGALLKENQFGKRAPNGRHTT